MLEQRRLAEAGDRAVLLDLDDAERGAHLRDDDRPRGAARLVLCEKRAEVDVEELVAVEREHRPLLPPPRGREPQPAAAAERLLLPHRLDLGAESGERVDERLLVSGAARDDHARHAALDEPRHPVLRERKPADRHERLRQPLRRLAQPLRLAAGEQERLHYSLVSSSGSAASGRTSVAEIRRPVPS